MLWIIGILAFIWCVYDMKVTINGKVYNDILHKILGVLVMWAVYFVFLGLPLYGLVCLFTR